MPTYLEVPYVEKDEAKQLGARWDLERKAWFVPDGVDTAAFSRWLPQEVEMRQRLIAPVWIVKSAAPCWKCHRTSRVFAVSASAVVDIEYDDDGEPEQTVIDDENGIVLNDLEAIDPRIEAFLNDLGTPGYTKDLSKTQGRRVYMNHCESCGAKLGDFFLHSDPGGAFFPTTTEEEALITCEQIFGEGEYLFSGSFSIKG